MLVNRYLVRLTANSQSLIAGRYCKIVTDMELLQKLEERIATRLMAMVRTAGEAAAERGQALYLVGGAVRDLLLDRINIDLDLVVEGDAIALARLLAERQDARVVAHDRFGTAKLTYRGFSLDLVTARSESYDRPGALPVVEPGSLQDDLRRRDFTINAMALGLSPPVLGQVVDPFGGQRDLRDGLVRVLHDRSFIDDATRLFRAIRYEHRLKFKLEEHTGEMARRDASFVHTISGDRLRHELELILAETAPEGILRRAGELGLLAQVHPALRSDDRLDRTFTGAREEFQPKQPPMSVYLSLMSWDLSLEECNELISRLNLPARVAHVMRDALRLKERLGEFRAGMTNSEVYQLLGHYLPSAIQTNIVAAGNPAAARYMRLFLTELRDTKIEIDGARLKAMGAPQGPALGKILHAIHMARLDGKVRDRAGEERLAQELVTGNR